MENLMKVKKENWMQTERKKEKRTIAPKNSEDFFQYAAMGFLILFLLFVAVYNFYQFGVNISIDKNDYNILATEEEREFRIEVADIKKEKDKEPIYCVNFVDSEWKYSNANFSKTFTESEYKEKFGDANIFKTEVYTMNVTLPFHETKYKFKADLLDLVLGKIYAREFIRYQCHDEEPFTKENSKKEITSRIKDCKDYFNDHDSVVAFYHINNFRDDGVKWAKWE